MSAAMLSRVLCAPIPLALVGAAHAQDRGTADEVVGVAVVELFTSQGCSSCPPADRLLSDIAASADRSGLPVYALSMHVDYWNSLGWEDPYSSPEFTNRQRAYARAQGANRVYTPQMVVNGSHEFLGSDRATARKAIREAILRPAATEVRLKVSPTADGRRWTVDYEIASAATGGDVVVCLVADAPANRVTRGENSGRSLEHAGVVRTLERRSLGDGPTGRVTLDWKDRDQATNDRVAVVAFVQDPRSRQIHGAARWLPAGS